LRYRAHQQIVGRGPNRPAELSRLFERLYRTESATLSGAEGHGRGLHICALLVEAQGGRVWVASTLPWTRTNLPQIHLLH
jgi:signal transduction histidine kinase